MLCVGYDVCYSAIITQVNLVLRRFTFAHVTSRRDHYTEVLYDVTLAARRNISVALRLLSKTALCCPFVIQDEERKLVNHKEDVEGCVEPLLLGVDWD